MWGKIRAQSRLPRCDIYDKTRREQTHVEKLSGAPDCISWHCMAMRNCRTMRAGRLSPESPCCTNRHRKRIARRGKAIGKARNHVILEIFRIVRYKLKARYDNDDNNGKGDMKIAANRTKETNANEFGRDIQEIDRSIANLQEGFLNDCVII